jgi:hypothetical protein
MTIEHLRIGILENIGGNMKYEVRVVQLLTAVALSVAVLGCAKSSNPLTPSSATPVSLSVAFSTNAAPITLMKNSGVSSVDSIRIDSAVVVFQRIKFESHIDSVIVDTSGNFDREDDSNLNVIFMGPFIVHVRDTVAINFASQMLPPGTYNGIKFKIHRMQQGEQGEDSDEFNHHHNAMPTDTSITGSSIIVWGAVKKNGSWIPFTYRLREELEFKIKGNFTVNNATNTVNIALNFNMGSWFVDPMSGSLLDPTNTSTQMYETISRAIRYSFEKGRGGEDHDHDGHPDD